VSPVIGKRMRWPVRVAILAVFGTLWGSGCLWLVLHGMRHGADFGALENPWQPSILHLHGWLAVGSVFLLGWVGASHASVHWSQRVRRPSGATLAGSISILVLTGYALYYTTDGLHEVAAVIHELLGGGAIVLALIHWRRFRPRCSLPGERPARSGARALHRAVHQAPQQASIRLPARADDLKHPSGQGWPARGGGFRTGS